MEPVLGAWSPVLGGHLWALGPILQIVALCMSLGEFKVGLFRELAFYTGGH